MNGDVRYLPCGFCGVTLGGSHQCPGCGTWWSRRNFHFGEYQPLYHKGTPEIFDLISDFPGGPLKFVWSGFDHDDEQAMEVFAAGVSELFFGKRYRFSTPPSYRDEDGALLDLFVPEAAPLREDPEERRLRNMGCSDEEIDAYNRIKSLKLDVLNPKKLAEKFLSLIVARNRELNLKCEGCGRMVDPKTCWCGDKIDHPYMDGHSGIPQGCICHYAKKEG
jgi:hypothetical protein